MVVPYCMIHYRKSAAEALAAVVAGLALGLLSMRTRSVMGGVVIHWAVAITADLAVIQSTGGFGSGG
jgi:membrane protease YdiL (CAAX protease family)